MRVDLGSYTYKGGHQAVQSLLGHYEGLMASFWKEQFFLILFRSNSILELFSSYLMSQVVCAMPNRIHGPSGFFRHILSATIMVILD